MKTISSRKAIIKLSTKLKKKKKINLKEFSPLPQLIGKLKLIINQILQANQNRLVLKMNKRLLKLLTLSKYNLRRNLLLRRNLNELFLGFKTKEEPPAKKPQKI